MAHRRIVDDKNDVWDVWEVIPAKVVPLPDDPARRTPRVSNPNRRIVVPPELQSGWLAFQCGEYRRRLAPLPSGWSEMSDTALLELMSRAAVVHPRAR